METKTIYGIIIDKTDNSIKINKLWIKFFKNELLQGIIKGDEVEVKYIDNVKDDKTYHNGKEIKKLTSNPVNTETNHKLDTSTVNTIIMCAKELVVSSMNGKRLTFKEALTEILNGLSEVTIKVKTD